MTQLARLCALLAVLLFAAHVDAQGCCQQNGQCQSCNQFQDGQQCQSCQQGCQSCNQPSRPYVIFRPVPPAPQQPPTEQPTPLPPLPSPPPVQTPAMQPVPGPAGPQGPAGPEGKQGPQGVPGEVGKIDQAAIDAAVSIAITNYFNQHKQPSIDEITTAVTKKLPPWYVRTDMKTETFLPVYLGDKLDLPLQKQGP